MAGLHTLLSGMGRLSKSPLQRMIGFGAVGYMAGSMSGQNPWMTGAIGAGVGAFAPQQLFRAAGGRVNIGRFGRGGYKRGILGAGQHYGWDPKLAKLTRRTGSIESAMPHRAFMTPRAESMAKGLLLGTVVGFPLLGATIGREYQEARIARDRRLSTVNDISSSYDFSGLQSSVSRAPTLGATGDIVLGSHKRRGGFR